MSDDDVACVGGQSLPNKRFGVMALASKARRWEVPKVTVDGAQITKVLHIFADQDRVGWPALQYMFLEMNARGALEPDMWHTTWNSVRKSMQQSNMWVAVLEATVVMKSKRGPFQGAAFLGTISGVADDYFQSANHDDPLFLHYSANICDDNGWHSAEFGSDSHRREVFQRIQSHAVLRNVGETVKLARWFSFFEAVDRHLLPGWHTLLLVLTALGLQKGWFRTLDDLQPLGAVSDCAGEGSIVEQVSHADRPTKSMKASSEEMKLKRAKCANTLHFCALALAQPLARQRIVLSCRLVGPLRQAQAKAITQCKTQRGCFAWYQAAAKREWVFDLLEVASVMHDTSALASAGLRSKADGDMEFCEEELEQQAALATLAVQLTTALLSKQHDREQGHVLGCPALVLRWLGVPRCGGPGAIVEVLLCDQRSSLMAATGLASRIILAFRQTSGGDSPNVDKSLMQGLVCARNPSHRNEPNWPVGASLREQGLQFNRFLRWVLKPFRGHVSGASGRSVGRCVLFKPPLADLGGPRWKPASGGSDGRPSVGPKVVQALVREAGALGGAGAGGEQHRPLLSS